MKKLFYVIWGIGMAAIFFFAVWSLVSLDIAEAHSWYDGECCSEEDCRQTTLGEVVRQDGGWYVTITKDTLPFTDVRLRRSLDPLIHICLMWENGLPKLRCLYIPEHSG